MVPFFGIFHPGELPRRQSVEAPAKASFFGGSLEAEPITRLEQDVAYLSGKAPEPQQAPPEPALPDNTLTGRLATF